MRIFKVAALVLIYTMFLIQVNAQSNADVVEIDAGDVTLVADYYAPTNENASAILLLHMVDSNRRAWNPLIPSLLEKGYAVLVPDLRGHGDSEGTQDWEAAVEDVQLWIDWLREQETVGEQIAIIGASMGGTLAIIGCANEPSCSTVIAFSAPFEGRGLTVESAVKEMLAERSLLAVATHGDEDFKIAAQQILEAASGTVSVRLYNGTSHGTTMFVTRRMRDTLSSVVVSWLEEHLE